MSFQSSLDPKFFFLLLFLLFCWYLYEIYSFLPVLAVLNNTSFIYKLNRIGDSLLP